MPETLARVEAIIERLNDWGVTPVTLLVVPGRQWSPAQIDRIRTLAGSGFPLAAHGWHHHTDPRRVYHRIHSLLISRNVAEHLDLDSSGVRDLINRSWDWFGKNTLPVPELYVPPAWALGRLDQRDFLQVPPAMIETTRGVLVRDGTGSRRFVPLPLTGFEADTPFRAFFLRRWNAFQSNKAIARGKPLRISVHPDDPQLRVADQMEELLRRDWDFIRYGEAV